MSGGYHPLDTYSESAARNTNSVRLIVNFEDAVHRQGDVELLAAIAIAKVAQLELQLAILCGDDSPAPDNVVPIRNKTAPTRLAPLEA